MGKKIFKILFSLAILSFVFLTSIYLFMHSTFFNIENIDIQGLNQLTTEEIIDSSGIMIGHNLFATDTLVIARVIQAHPLVKEAHVNRQLPNTIEIKVLERQIWAIVPYDEEYLCIDDEGIVIDRRIKFDLLGYPLISFSNLPDKINIGQALKSQGILLIKTVWDFKDGSLRDYISDFYYNDKGELIIYTVSGTEIRFGNGDRVEEKLTFFTEILKFEKELEQSGQEILEYVDLRYKGQPVVKTKT